MIKIISVGDYPRIGDKPEEQILRRALHRYDAGEITTDEVEKARNIVLQQIAQEQQTYLDVITDGHVSWEDSISHFFRHCHNVDIGPLEIFFSTNRLYRKPLVKGVLSIKDHFLRQEYETVQKYSKKPIRVVITGPYTLARSVETPIYQKTLEEITIALNEELRTLNNCAIDEIQIDEPWFSEKKPYWRGYKNILQELAKNVKHSIALNPYWTNLAPEMESVAELPIQTIHYDLARFPFDNRLFHWSGNVVLGIIDAEKRKLEDTTILKKTIAPFLQKYNCVSLSANTGLCYLPRESVQEKMKLLATIREELS